jgi:hypothetical protein
MRFLLDNNLSPRLAGFLRAGGHEVVHVRDIGMASATDPVVIDAARVQGRVLISADTDFGTPVRPHARHHALVPAPPASKWTTRIRAGGDHPSNLNVVQADLDAGAIVVLGDATLRIRRLPIGAPDQSG